MPSWEKPLPSLSLLIKGESGEVFLFKKIVSCFLSCRMFSRGDRGQYHIQDTRNPSHFPKSLYFFYNCIRRPTEKGGRRRHISKPLPPFLWAISTARLRSASLHADSNHTCLAHEFDDGSVFAQIWRTTGTLYLTRNFLLNSNTNFSHNLGLKRQDRMWVLHRHNNQHHGQRQNWPQQWLLV